MSNKIISTLRTVKMISVLVEQNIEIVNIASNKSIEIVKNNSDIYFYYTIFYNIY